MPASHSHFGRWTALILFLSAASTVVLAIHRPFTPIESLPTGVANCSLVQANVLECVYLTATDMGMLTQWMQTAQTTYGAFSLLLRACDSAAFTSDIFTGFTINELTVELCGVSTVPWDTYLTSIASNLTYLGFLDNNITTVTKPATPPTFINTLLSFDMPGNNIQSIDDGAFDDYGILSTIDLDDNQLTSIGQHFRGLYALQQLDLSSNRISSIADNAFQDLFFAESLELQGNLLTTLQQAAFSGLDYVPSINLIGNPFDCTCDLQWLKDWLNGKGILYKSGATCATPVNAPFADYEFCPAKSL